jgi:chemotaxis protein CheD
MIKVIGIGGYAVSNNEEDIIKTFALGSCIALVIYCPIIKRLGMVHIALPDSSIIEGTEKNLQPGYFADTAVPLIFNKTLGGFRTYSNSYKVSLFGGAHSKNGNDIFSVGLKNIIKIETILEENRIKYDSTNTGGCNSRTIQVDVKTGTPIIRLQLIKI